MKKLDVEATEAKIRAQWAAVAALPNMQHEYGQLQSTGYAVDMSVAGTMWAQSITQENEPEAVLMAAGAITSNFIVNLMVARIGDTRKHEALHLILNQVYTTTHAALGFDDSDPSLSVTDMDAVMKDVGDA